MKNNVGSEDSSSDNDSPDSQDEFDNTNRVVQRGKRYVHHTRTVIEKESWCDTNTNLPPLQPSGFEPPPPPVRRVVWPPPSNTSAGASTSQFDLRHVPFGRPRHGYPNFGNPLYGNPQYGSKMQLYSKTGYFLGVYPDGRVTGTRDDNDLHTYLEVVSAGVIPEHVKIRGMLTNMYVAMDSKGRLYAESDPMAENTVFIESFHGSYNAYLSRKWAHLGWYIGIKKSGRPKKGSKTGYGQKAVKFLPRRTKFE